MITMIKWKQWLDDDNDQIGNNVWKQLSDENND